MGKITGTGCACERAPMSLGGAAALEPVRARVAAAAPRIAQLGGWPEWIGPDSLTARVPTSQEPAAGFDAGIACALDLIPRGRQRLAACLHAAYTPQAVAQVRAEARSMDPGSDTAWWLAACSVCTEGKLAPDEFLSQIRRFSALAGDPAARLAAARAELDGMLGRFAIRDGVAFSVQDGGMQGAYLAGHDVAAMHAPEAGLWFVGTIRPSLQLDDFEWQEPADPDAGTLDGRLGRSGPVHGSRQFVKCADEDEYARVIAAVRSRLGAGAF